MANAALNLPEFVPGSVWLVGAGPGDPGLLTLLALHALEHADVVVYDALVAPAILKLVRQGAVLEHAGKRGGKPSTQQPDISLRLVALAREGKRVLRLKGGDPFVFGRGGEEGLALARAHIPFRVVPGITAAIGGLAYAGIPATHRDANSAITFITGQTSGGTLPNAVDWEAMARGTAVLVIYMALRNLDAIARRLIAAGRPADEPVAIISKATTDEQRVIETTLAAAAEDAAAAALEPPALIAIGPVVKLRRELDWLGQVAANTLPRAR
ncbi:MAG TPA: uroporphyrinogen-III C-methyltransferase [Stellaceae bacterium]|jgi:uroporphyrin-III C-methyltransferase|nr:uroporphyrinogen-III C-methyltransferase [Stellaceae bacterium]